MKKSSKGSILGSLLLIIIIVFVAIGVYGYFKENTLKNSQQMATTTISEKTVPKKITTSSSTSNQQKFSETTLTISKFNGNFAAGNIWNVTDSSGKKWTVNYGDALFYYEDKTMNPPDWPGDINAWLDSDKSALVSGKFDPSEGIIKILGTSNTNGTFTASNIIQELK